MRRSIKAFSQGFWRFEVNGRRFWSFERASDEAAALCLTRLTVTFSAWSLKRWLLRSNNGWTTLLVREKPGPSIYDLSEDRWLESA